MPLVADRHLFACLPAPHSLQRHATAHLRGIFVLRSGRSLISTALLPPLGALAALASALALAALYLCRSACMCIYDVVGV